jgi:predicted nucleic acid-binding protein
MSGMEKAVIDASIIVKWFVEESGSKDALSIRDRYVEGTLEIIAPSLLHYEVLNTLHFKGLFTPLELHDASSALDSYSFDLRQLNGEYAKAALRIASAHSISLYDASYVALACMEKAPFYTADGRLARRVSARSDVSVVSVS